MWYSCFCGEGNSLEKEHESLDSSVEQSGHLLLLPSAAAPEPAFSTFPLLGTKIKHTQKKNKIVKIMSGLRE